MKRYCCSKRRLLLFAVLMGAIALSVGRGYAGEAATTQQAAQQPSMFSIVMMLVRENADPVFFTIFGCSIVAVALIVKGFMQVRPSVLMPESSVQTIRLLIAKKQWDQLLEFTAKDNSFVSKALHPALKRAPDYSAMKEAMETAIGEQTAEQFRRIEYLNIIGNLGPLLGLLGTVLGMIGSFAALKAAGGNAKPDELAGGISAALTHTFLGLMLAVPCLAAFGVLRTMVDRLTIRGSLTAEELLLSLKPEEKLTDTSVWPSFVEA